MVLCPLCDGPAFTQHIINEIPLCQCRSCHHVFADFHVDSNYVASIYSDEYFRGGQVEYENYLGGAALLRAQGRRYAKKLTRYMPTGRVLDVGCAAGFLLGGFVDAGWTGVGVEANQSMCDHAVNELKLNVYQAEFEEFESSERFDLINFIQVLSHFIRPDKAFHKAAELTGPTGHCLVETWNRSSLTAKMLGRRWHQLKPPSVLHWFDRSGLDRLAAETGWRKIATGHAKKLIRVENGLSVLRNMPSRGVLGRSLAAVLRAVPKSLAIPYPGDDVFWVLFCKA